MTQINIKSLCGIEQLKLLRAYLTFTTYKMPGSSVQELSSL